MSNQLILDDVDPNINNVNGLADPNVNNVNGIDEKLNNMKIDDFFVVPEPDETAIALIDTSASTTYRFAKRDPVKGYLGAECYEQSVFAHQCETLKRLPHKKFFIMFWCSKQARGLFEHGYRAIPGAVSKESMELLFKTEYNRIEGRFLTNTALAFQNLPEKWLQETKTVYLVTDGDMGGGDLDQAQIKRNLTNSLKYFRGNLSIFTVEKDVRNYNDINEVNQAAGTDVYMTIQSKNLTNFICQFVSHYPGQFNEEKKCAELESFTHINKVIAPLGFLPYGDKYFLEVNMDRFIQHVANEIKTDNSESNQLKIAQKLSNTMYHLLKNKTQGLIEHNIRSFSQLFTLDQQVIYYILGESILQEREGKAQILADYRKNMQNLFKDAQRKLGENVASAIGMSQGFTSFPVIVSDEKTETRRILLGPFKLMTETFSCKAGSFPRSCVQKTPVFGISAHLSMFNEQCIRQWARTVYSTRFNVNIQDDLIVYLVLGETLAINKSLVDATVKGQYRHLSKIMLNKKRTSVEMTEAKYLLEGNAPGVHDGDLKATFEVMRNAMMLLNIVGTAQQFWHDVMQTMDDVIPGIFNAQKMHCTLGDNNQSLILPTYELDVISTNSVYDYNCYLTLDDLTSTGGFVFLEHKSPTGFHCQPIFMLSKSAMQDVVHHNKLTCPVCYSRLSVHDFGEVGPRIESKIPDCYNQPYTGTKKKSGNINWRSPNDHWIIYMRGTVGAGKTTLSDFIQKKYTELGYKVFNVGTDKYCAKGMQMKSAIGSVKNELRRALGVPGKCIVIIDTCGEFKSKTPFDVDFSSWRSVEVYPNLDRNNLMGYLAWSLTNVLNRGASGNFYLCPSSKPGQEGINLCKDVHRKKATSLGLLDRNFNSMSDSDRIYLAAQYAKTVKPVEFELPSQ